jgi:predicted GNAT superfamily acetyltransferase
MSAKTRKRASWRVSRSWNTPRGLEEDWLRVPSFAIDRQHTTTVNRLVVARRRAGEGLGYCVLDSMCEVVHELGRSSVALDCWAGNTRLRTYYASAGFTFLGIARRKEDADSRLAFFQRSC